MSRDESGRPRALARANDPRERLLARFLELDVVEPTHAAELLRAARSAAGPAHRSSGNAFLVSIGPKRTTITAHVEPRSGPGSIALPTEQFRAVVADWLGLLEDRRRGSRRS